MHLDVVELRAFYYRTKLGRATKANLQMALEELWSDVEGQNVAGFGFAVQLLRPYLGKAARVISLMPGQQGVMAWPAGEPNISVLVEETSWPIEAGTIDKLVIAHGLETCERPDALLAEVARVLAPGGSAIFIVPNRGGFWARRDATPFGYGRPYSLRQLEGQLRKNRLYPENHRTALHAPPSDARFWLKTWGLWERVGRRLGRNFMHGALIVEATKQVYIMPKGGTSVSIKKPLEVLGGLAQPKPKAASGRNVIRLRNRALARDADA